MNEEKNVNDKIIELLNYDERIHDNKGETIHKSDNHTKQECLKDDNKSKECFSKDQNNTNDNSKSCDIKSLIKVLEQNENIYKKIHEHLKSIKNVDDNKTQTGNID